MLIWCTSMWKKYGRWPDKFYDIFPENIETAKVSYVMIKLIPFNDSWRKEGVIKNSMSCFKEKDIMHISSNIIRAPWKG